jgi:hypothetical protein
MREIKIRAWDWKTIFFPWHFSVNNQKDNRLSFSWFDLMQYTWLKDKNWKEIYEWDIILYLASDWSSKPDSDLRSLEEYLEDKATKWVILWNQWQFDLSYKDKKYNDFWFMSGRRNPWPHWFVKVLWNVYENRDLIDE